MKIFLLVCLLILAVGGTIMAEYETDVIPVADGDVVITHIGHGTLMFEYRGLVIHIDPVGREGNYRELPAADIVLVTHEHGDHLDNRAIDLIRGDSTSVIHNLGTAEKIEGGTVLENGESISVSGVNITAVPAYNITEGRDRFHPKGRDNGYVLTIGGKRFYVAGDTEDHQEMLDLENIFVAFLPANQPYTMLPTQVVRAAKAFMPEILYPYHYGKTDIQSIVEGLEDTPAIEVRIRELD